MLFGGLGFRVKHQEYHEKNLSLFDFPVYNLNEAGASESLYILNLSQALNLRVPKVVEA